MLGLLLLVSCFVSEGTPMVLKSKKVIQCTQLWEQKGMIVALDQDNRRWIVSKNLILWDSLMTDLPEFFADHCPLPEQQRLRKEADVQAKRQQTATPHGRKKITITNKDLKPYQSADHKQDMAYMGNGAWGKGVIKKMGETTEDIVGLLTGNKNAQPAASAPREKIQRLRPKIASGAPVIETIAKGEKVELKGHLEPGKYTIFDFYADWCGPCRALTPQLEALVNRYPDHVALKKIDIVRWGTPVSQQYSIRSIPHVKLFNDRGTEVNGVVAHNVAAKLESIAKKEGW
jgi:thioredoxin 1